MELRLGVQESARRSRRAADHGRRPQGLPYRIALETEVQIIGEHAIGAGNATAAANGGRH
jgi:hypothetical protein